MAHLFDTSALIAIRDNEEGVRNRMAALRGELLMSAISLAELEGGVARDPKQAERRRALLDLLTDGFRVVPFSEQEARVYGQILSSTGYSRRKLIDRMIGASAVVSSVPLVTFNPKDFQDIPGLKIVDWSV